LAATQAPARPPTAAGGGHRGGARLPLERWTRAVIRFRWLVLSVWLAVALAGGWSLTRLSSVLSNSFAVPGSDSERARTILQDHFGDRSDGSFTVVFRIPQGVDSAVVRRLQARVDRAARAVPTGSPTALRVASPTLVYGDVVSALTLAKAKPYAATLLRALGQIPGVTTYVTGGAAIEAAVDPILSGDLARSEAIAVPIAFAILVAVLGLSLAITVPFIFAAATITATLGLVFLIAHEVSTATYVTNLVQGIGLGIAVDYSLLIVYRFREELAAGDAVTDAVVRTMATAGRAVIVSGAMVAVGLSTLLLTPVPFIRSMGIGGFIIPLASIAAAATLQPALLSVYGRRGSRRLRVAAFLRERLRLPLPRGPHTHDAGLWTRIARSIMRRSGRYLALGLALLVLAAVPALGLHLTPGSTAGIPRFPQAVQGYDVLKAAVGPGAISPSQIVVDTGRRGGVASPAVQAAIGRLTAVLRRDPEVELVLYRLGGRFVDATRRYAQVIVAGRHAYGEQPSQRFVHRLRDDLIPAARFPAGTTVLAGGSPGQGVDFLGRTYSFFPYLALAVILVTFVLLMRAFRSVLIPLKAVLANILSVGAAYGVLVVVFRYGVGERLLGLYHAPQISGWIPIFLFAMLFGLSMDYEVFLISRMRERWDATHDNERAVAEGLERTGRIVTAAAVIMVAAFSGFVAGRIVDLQELGIGLAFAILIDAFLVRSLLVPSAMALLGRLNWWLPEPLARLVHVPASPLGGRPAGEG